MKLENNFKNPLRSIFLSWFVLTAVYVALTFLINHLPGFIGTPVGYIFGFIGLFVPYGLYSLALFLQPNAWYSLIFFVVVMVAADNQFRKINITLGNGILINLAILFILTMAIDIIRGTPFASFGIFFSGGNLFQVFQT